VGRIQTTAGLVVLRISIGVHSGRMYFFAVGDSHRELVVAGPDATATVDAEGTATAGEIVMSAATAAALPSRCRGAARGDAFLLRAPSGQPSIQPVVVADPGGVDAARFVPVAVRRHLLDGADESEHRSATVAFLHVDGPDEMLVRDGPDVLAERLDEMVRVVQAATEEHDVTLLGSDIDHDGGKLILVSGVPKRAGDDEQRMLLTLRRIRDTPLTIPLRIGAHTGAVFSGAVGPGYRRTFTVMGDTVNLAARVMSKAQPGQVLVTPDVLDRSGLVFSTTALEPFAVKGKRKPVTAFELGAPERERRARTARLPLVGRDDAMATLEAALGAAAEGRPSFVEIVGEAGLGKSRLIEELRARAGGTRCVTIRSELYEADTPYAAFWLLLRFLLDVELTAHRDVVLAALRAPVAARAPDLLAARPLLATPLDLDVPDTPEIAVLEPQFRRERVDDATAAFVARLLPGPTLLVFEHVHYMDELSSGVLHRLVARQPATLLLCATRRPAETGFAADEDESPVVVAVEPLTEAEAHEAVLLATADAPLLPHDSRALAQRAAGSPLFLDELLRTFAEGAALPDSIGAAVTAQVDRLPTAQRAILRRASVLGMSFDRNELADVLAPDIPMPDDAGLRELGEFLVPEGAAGLRFRQAVTRDAVYEKMPFRQRRELHRRVASALEAALGAEADAEAGLLSMHHFSGQQYAEAWHYAVAAGERAWSMYANGEAVSYFERAAAAGRRLPDLDPASYAAVLERLGDANERLGAYEPASRAFRAARRLLAGDPLRTASLFLKESWIPERTGRYPEAVRAVRKGLSALDPVVGDEADQRRAELMTWYAAMRQDQGRHREAIEWCERAIELARASGFRRGEAHASFILDWAWVSLGRFDLATHSARALEIYAELGDLTGEAGVLQNLGGFAYYQGKWDEAVELYERGRDARLRTGNEVDAAMGTCNIAEVLADQGRYDEADQHLDDALRVLRAARYRTGVAFARSLQGRVAARRGDFDAARELLDEARAEYTTTGLDADVLDVDSRIAEHFVLEGRWQEALDLADSTLDELLRVDDSAPTVPMLLRVRGHALAQLHERDAARAAFEASIEAGRARDAVYDVALTQQALAQLLRAQGSDVESYSLLAESAATLRRLGVQRMPEVPIPA
jgi:class 3 adenylate cyclase/tetratricopeptide (TPR) repeat protein